MSFALLWIIALLATALVALSDWLFSPTSDFFSPDWSVGVVGFLLLSIVIVFIILRVGPENIFGRAF